MSLFKLLDIVYIFQQQVWVFLYTYLVEFKHASFNTDNILGCLLLHDLTCNLFPSLIVEDNCQENDSNN